MSRRRPQEIRWPPEFSPPSARLGSGPPALIACRRRSPPQSSSFSTIAKELTQRINDGFRCIDQNNLIPSDKLPAFKACLLAEFPGNSTVAEIFDEQSEIWIIGWQ